MYCSTDIEKRSLILFIFCRLEFCNVSDKGCTFLALALRSNLKELDLSGNKLTNSGLKILSDELQNHLCKLEKLWYNYF